MRRTGGSSADAERLRDAWSALHGGYDADGSLVLRAWLAVMHHAARPLARRGVSPDVVTAAGVGLAAGAVGAARMTPAGASLLVLGSVVLDGVDGAVAIAAGRLTAHGARLDTISDRVADACFALALRRMGAPPSVSVLAALAPTGLEAVRARVTDNRRRGVGKLTVGDRPARVSIVLGALLVASLDREHEKLIGATAAALLVCACAAGAAQLSRGSPVALPWLRHPCLLLPKSL